MIQQIIAILYIDYCHVLDESSYYLLSSLFGLSFLLQGVRGAQSRDECFGARSAFFLIGGILDAGLLLTLFPISVGPSKCRNEASTKLQPGKPKTEPQISDRQKTDRNEGRENKAPI